MKALLVLDLLQVDLANSEGSVPSEARGRPTKVGFVGRGYKLVRLAGFPIAWGSGSPGKD